MYQIAIIPVRIYTGGKRYDMVCIRHRNTRIISRIGEYCIHKLLEIFWLRKRICISSASIPAGIAGYDLIFQYRTWNIDIKTRILLVQALIVVMVKRPKHTSIFHIMAIDDGIAVCKVRLVMIIHKNTSVLIRLPVKHVVQVIVIIIALNHWIADIQGWYLNPCDNIRVYLLKPCKINLQITFSIILRSFF